VGSEGYYQSWGMAAQAAISGAASGRARHTCKPTQTGHENCVDWSPGPPPA